MVALEAVHDNSDLFILVPGFFELLCNFLYLLSVLWLDSLNSLLLVWFYF